MPSGKVFLMDKYSRFLRGSKMSNNTSCMEVVRGENVQCQNGIGHAELHKIKRCMRCIYTTKDKISRNRWRKVYCIEHL